MTHSRARGRGIANSRAYPARTARAWHYREPLRDILTRKQPNVVHVLLKRWCSNVLRSKVEPMKEVARMIRSHLEGILAWATSRQTNGFLEAINGLFQAAKRTGTSAANGSAGAVSG